MSILNSPFSDKEIASGAFLLANETLAGMLPKLDERTRALIEATADGTTIGLALGVTKEQKGALLDLGCRLIQVGELDKAQDVLMRLNMYDPYEERALYALGAICQLRGDLQRAAHMYIQFLALDATNPIGYLRVGECLRSAGEYAEAFSALEMAESFASDGKGQPGNLEEARRLLAVPEIAAAGAALKAAGQT